MRRPFVLIALLPLALAGCGNGDTPIFGIGNGGNHYGNNEIEEVARSLAKATTTPRVTDDLLNEIFAAIVDRAERGDAEAALVILKVAERQRQPE